ncbi:MAG: phosphatase PAP2 family protein [Ignavibacteriaceae bacterium]
MTKNSKNRSVFFNYIIISFAVMGLARPVYSQSAESDSSFHPYYVNYWVSGSIIGVGAVANILGIPESQNKSVISPLEFQTLNKSIINNIDSWALKQDPSKTAAFENYSTYALVSTVVLPAILIFDKRIRHDWLNILLMYAETMSITTNIYEWSFLGPTFQNKFRPITYYDQVTYDQKNAGTNRNSFYSGHVAVAAAATFFMAKVFCDYNPGIGNNKYLIYGAAAIPPLILGFFRVKALMHFPSDVMVGLGLGALVGIIIPELHHLPERNMSLGVFSTNESTGIAITWQPNFLK